MTFDWSVVWAHAGELLQGTELTVLLAIVTMALAIPGGIVLAALSALKALSLIGSATAISPAALPSTPISITPWPSSRNLSACPAKPAVSIPREVGSV